MTECIYLLKLDASIVQRVRGRRGAGQHCCGFISLSQHLRIDKIPNMCPICFHSNCPHLCRALIGRASITRPLELASDWSAQLTGARRPPQVTAPAGRRQRFSLPRRVGTRGCVSFINLQDTVLHRPSNGCRGQATRGPGPEPAELHGETHGVPSLRPLLHREHPQVRRLPRPHPAPQTSAAASSLRQPPRPQAGGGLGAGGPEVRPPGPRHVAGRDAGSLARLRHRQLPGGLGSVITENICFGEKIFV